MPNECDSIGHSPGPTDHLYNAGTVGWVPREFNQPSQAYAEADASCHRGA